MTTKTEVKRYNTDGTGINIIIAEYRNRTVKVKHQLL